MKIREVTVKLEKSKNFQNYGISLRARLELNDDCEQVVKELQTIARKRVMEQMEIDK